MRKHLDAAAATTEMIIGEPSGRNTAPAIAAACAYLALGGRDEPVVVLPSDQLIPKVDEFAETIADLIPAADAGYIGLIGVKPNRPDETLGYIKLSARDGVGNTRRVARFIEKPSSDDAAQLISDGDVFWNTGIFCFKPSTMIRQFKRHARDIWDPVLRAVTSGTVADGRLRIDENNFAQAPAISIDYAIMEKTDAVVCRPTDLEWSDLGNWNALWHAGARDAEDNLTQGNIVLSNVRSSVLFSSGPLVAAVGLSDVAVVATPDAVLVAHRDQASHLSTLVDDLQPKYHRETHEPLAEQRPWGTFRKLGAGERYQIKEIIVRPRSAMSLQRHKHRDEHWLIVQGEAEVKVGDLTNTASEGDRIHVPAGELHRIANAGATDLILIEIQLGLRISEDDIERIDDTYGR